MIQNIKLNFFNEKKEFIGVLQVIKNNYISMLCLFLIILSLVFLISFGIFRKKGLENPETIQKLSNINEMNLSFFITYILPLVTMDINDIKSMIVFIVIMLFIVMLLTKTNLYYANPVLSLLGYNIFEIDTHNKNKIIVIIKDDISKNEKIFLKPISKKNDVYYGKKAGK